MPGQYWGAKLGRACGGGLLPRRVPASSWLGRPPADAARHLELQQRVSQGRAGARDAEEAAGPGAVLGRASTAISPAMPTATRPATISARRCSRPPAQSLAWFWSQWIYQAGYPEFAVTLALRLRRRRARAHRAADPGGHRHAPTAPASASARRSVVPGADRHPGGHRRGRRASRGSSSTGGSRSIADRRGRSRRRPWSCSTTSNAMLKTLDFEQPTALARHTSWPRDPDLWNRSWAIDQLAGRTGDSLAAAALARAARGADYYAHPRAGRGRACGGSRRAGRCRRWRRRSRDTLRARCGRRRSRRWRTVGGERGLGPGAAGLEERLELRGPRRGAHRLGSARFRRIARAVRAGLATPSYRDVIQNAAIAAAAHRRTRR